MNDNNYSSVKGQAKKGLSTFVLTLSISLIVFSTIYYLMTKSSSNIDDVSAVSGSVVNDEKVGTAVIKEESDTEETIFGEIASADPNTTYKQVLAGADDATTTDPVEVVPQTTQSDPNLNTGVTSITVGLISAFTLFLASIIFVSKNPRKFALSTFEKKTTKGL